MSIELRVKIDKIDNEVIGNLSSHYRVSKSAYFGDSGIDLLIDDEVVCKANRVTFINHKICCEMVNVEKKFFKETRNNISYMLVPRSSLSKTPLIMANSIGIIDSGYRGHITAAVYNTSNKDYTIYSGSRLFQIISPALETFKLTLVNELSESERGNNGYGSSNKKSSTNKKRPRKNNFKM